MKKTNFLFCAAAAMVLSSAAMAQNVMTATIPFDFQFGGTTLPAGQYRVDTSRATLNGVVLVQNASTREAVMRIGIHNSTPAQEVRPRLVFRCGEAGCALNQIWVPSAEYIYSLPKADASQYRASIPLTTVKAD